MTQGQFEIFKTARIAKLKANNACQTQLDRAIAANTPEDYLKVIVENINWLGRYKAITSDELLQFGDELLLANGIYVRKNAVAKLGKIYFSSTVKAYFSSTVEAYDSSTVEAYDSSTVKAYDSSTVKAYGSSKVEAYDSSTVKAYDSSTVKAYFSSTVKAYGSSTVEAYGSSTVEAYDSSTVKAYDSSTVKAYDSSNILKGNGDVEIKSDNAFIRELGTPKIYVRKGKFEIIEI